MKERTQAGTAHQAKRAHKRDEAARTSTLLGTVHQGYLATGGHERGGHWQAQYILGGVGEVQEVMKEMDAGRYGSASS
jgi:hypothetical protein